MNDYKKNVFMNLFALVMYVLYFYLLNFSYTHLKIDSFINIYKYFSIGALAVTIIIFEFAYKKDNGKIATYGIETLILSIVSLISLNMINKFKITFYLYINCFCVMYLIYYILKFIVLYTINRRLYLKSLSDIKEIVTSEPLKKEARKRNN